MDNNLTEEKTVEQILQEKKILEDVIKCEVDAFLKNNPCVESINFTTDITMMETRCGHLKEFEVSIKIEL